MSEFVNVAYKDWLLNLLTHNPILIVIVGQMLNERSCPSSGGLADVAERLRRLT
jgi:hypothetical protein